MSNALVCPKVNSCRYPVKQDYETREDVALREEPELWRVVATSEERAFSAEGQIEFLEQLILDDPFCAAAVVTEVLLDEDTDQLLKFVAGQRARSVPLTMDQRNLIWPILLDMLGESEQSSDLSYLRLKLLPSILELGREKSIDFLVDVLETGTPEEAEAIAAGIFDGSPQAGSRRESLGADAERLFRVSLKRLQERDEELPTLLWSLGAVASEDKIDFLCELLVERFRAARGLEDAACVRLGRMLVKRWPQKSIFSISKAFGDVNSASHFLSLLMARI